MRVLFSWIGIKDLCYIAKNLDSPKFTTRVEEIRNSYQRAGQLADHSPTVSIIDHYLDETPKIRFDKLILFCDWQDEVLINGIKNFLGRRIEDIEIFPVRPADVHDYAAVLSPAVKQWHMIEDKDKTTPYFNLSSGTTAMKAFLTIAGQATYPQTAKFLHVEVKDSKKQVEEINLFNLASFAINETLSNVDRSMSDSGIIGECPGIKKAKMLAAKAAKTDCNVLIYGETGTGKELFARMIHEKSNRKEKPFAAINCAALSPQLLEDSLFGHTKGSFTGADKDKDGLLSKLNGGTLFLDELEACPAELQDKLLRVLQPPKGKPVTCRVFQKHGKEDEDIESDVRIIGATNKLLDSEEFRSDLLNRLATLCITIPPLRDRKGDLRLLTESLFDEIKKELGSEFTNKTLCESSIKFIETRAWRGNVRELKNALTQAIVFSDSDVITEEDFRDRELPARTDLADTDSSEQSGCPAIDLSQPIDIIAVTKKHDLEVKQKYVAIALEKTAGNKTQAAELLGTSSQTLDNWKKAWKKIESK